MTPTFEDMLFLFECLLEYCETIEKLDRLSEDMPDLLTTWTQPGTDNVGTGYPPPKYMMHLNAEA